MMQNQEVKKEMDDLLDQLSLYAGEGHEEEARSWLLAAVLRIWSVNQWFAEDYLPVLRAIKEQPYSVAQVVTALDCAGEQGRMLRLPCFIQKLAEQDVKENTAFSRRMITVIGEFLTVAALANGDFTTLEAREVDQICKALEAYCDQRQVLPGNTWNGHSELVTPLDSMGYISPGMIEKRVEKDVPPLILPDHSQETTDSSADEASFYTAEEKEKGTPKADIAGGETLESVLSELDALVGLARVKEDVHSLLNFLKICRVREKRGLKVPTVSYHLVFTGNPGTGKTTVARLVAKLYYLMGLLPQGQLIETDRSGLVAGYLGQTAIKTQKVINEALGGVLFIDEAYSLANDKEDSYGKEAIETILKAMEDHRDELVVIVAGYDELMHRFIDSNPGLRSRFNKYFHFPDYDGTDLLLILKHFCENNSYTLSEEAQPLLQERLQQAFESREEHFGNARAVRNVFEHAINHQANRLVLSSALTDRQLCELTVEDILPALEVLRHD